MRNVIQKLKVLEMISVITSDFVQEKFHIFWETIEI